MGSVGVKNEKRSAFRYSNMQKWWVQWNWCSILHYFLLSNMLLSSWQQDNLAYFPCKIKIFAALLLWQSQKCKMNQSLSLSIWEMAPMIKMDGHMWLFPTFFIYSNIFYVMVAYLKEYFQPRLTKNVPVAIFFAKTILPCYLHISQQIRSEMSSERC